MFALKQHTQNNIVNKAKSPTIKLHQKHTKHIQNFKIEQFISVDK